MNSMMNVSKGIMKGNQFIGMPHNVFDKLTQMPSLSVQHNISRVESQAIQYMCTTAKDRCLSDYCSTMRSFDFLYPPNQFNSDNMAKLLSDGNLGSMCYQAFCQPLLIWQDFGGDQTVGCFSQIFSNLNKSDRLDYSIGNDQLSGMSIMEKNNKLFVGVNILACLIAIIDERFELFVANKTYQQIIDNILIYQQLTKLNDHDYDCNYRADKTKEFIYEELCLDDNVLAVLPMSFWLDFAHCSNLILDLDTDKSEHNKGIRSKWYKRMVVSLTDYIDGCRIESMLAEGDNGNQAGMAAYTNQNYVELRAKTTGQIPFFDILGIMCSLDIDDEVYQGFIKDNEFSKHCGIVSGLYNDIVFYKKDEISYNSMKTKVEEIRSKQVSINVDYDQQVQDIVHKSLIMAKNRCSMIDMFADTDLYQNIIQNIANTIDSTRKHLKSSKQAKQVTQLQLCSLFSGCGVIAWQLTSHRYQKLHSFSFAENNSKIYSLTK